MTRAQLYIDPHYEISHTKLFWGDSLYYKIPVNGVIYPYHIDDESGYILERPHSDFSGKKGSLAAYYAYNPHIPHRQKILAIHQELQRTLRKIIHTYDYDYAFAVSHSFCDMMNELAISGYISLEMLNYIGRKIHATIGGY